MTGTTPDSIHIELSMVDFTSTPDNVPANFLDSCMNFGQRLRAVLANRFPGITITTACSMSSQYPDNIVISPRPSGDAEAKIRSGVNAAIDEVHKQSGFWIRQQ